MKIIESNVKALSKFLSAAVDPLKNIQIRNDAGEWVALDRTCDFPFNLLDEGRIRILESGFRPFKVSEVPAHLLIRYRERPLEWKSVLAVTCEGLFFLGMTRAVTLSYEAALGNLECSLDGITWTPCGVEESLSDCVDSLQSQPESAACP